VCPGTFAEFCPSDDHPQCFLQLYEGFKVYIKADNGFYLQTVSNAGLPVIGNPYVGKVSGSLGDLFSQYIVEHASLNVALHSENGNYLSDCNSCWFDCDIPSDSVTVHVTNPAGEPWGQWRPAYQGGCSWGFFNVHKQDYMSYYPACDYGNFGFFLTNGVNPQSIWEVTMVSPCADGTYSDAPGSCVPYPIPNCAPGQISGGQCTRCDSLYYPSPDGTECLPLNDPNCIHSLGVTGACAVCSFCESVYLLSTWSSSSNVCPATFGELCPSGNQALCFLQLYQGFKVYIQANNGLYLQTVSGAALPTVDNIDAAQVSGSLGDLGSQYIVEPGESNVAFHSNNGKYLAFCDGCWYDCAPSGHSVTVHVSTPVGQPWGQWIPNYQGNCRWGFFNPHSQDYMTYADACGSNFGFFTGAGLNPQSTWGVTMVNPCAAGTYSDAPGSCVAYP
jgi:hypothetical protein